MAQEKTQELSEVKDKQDFVKTIVVYNDDVNTFDHVIGCFMMILKFDMDKAAQAAYTIHTEGKCDVKSGSYNELEPYALALLNQHLSAKIE